MRTGVISYLFIKNGFSFKTFFRAEKHGKRLWVFCGVICWAALFPFPPAELQLGDS